MDKVLDLELQATEKRAELTKLVDVEKPDEGQETRMLDITRELRSLDTRLGAAKLVEASTHETRTENHEDAEQRERRELRSKCLLGRYLKSAMQGRQVGGVEAEYSAACGADGGIPTSLWQAPERREHQDGDGVERRAATPVPGTVGVNMAMVEPFVFAPSIAARLGIDVRDVPSGSYAVPVITTAPSTATPKAKGADADSTAGALGVKTATPKRIPAQLTLRIEDIAAIGTESFEPMLRQALQMKLADSTDDQIINGNGAGANLSGLLHQLTDPGSNPSAVVTFTSAAETIAAFVDGLWAMSLRELSVIAGVATYQKLAATFQVPMTSGANGELSSADYLMNALSGFATNKRMPGAHTSGTFNKSQDAIVARLGQPGIMRAMIPSWGTLQVDDIYSEAGKGLRHFVVSALVGDLMLVQGDAYQQMVFRLTT